MKSFRKDAFAVPVSVCLCVRVNSSPGVVQRLEERDALRSTFFHQGQRVRAPRPGCLLSQGLGAPGRGFEPGGPVAWQRPKPGGGQSQSLSSQTQLSPGNTGHSGWKPGSFRERGVRHGGRRRQRTRGACVFASDQGLLQ